MVKEESKVKVSVTPYESSESFNKHNLDQIIFDLNQQIELLTSNADNLDYLISVASGILCGLLDVLWVGEFDLSQSRDTLCKNIDNLVVRIAKMRGCDKDNLRSCVSFLEKESPIPSDGNTSDFGGGLQHHLRDFAHHPTIVGLIFSLITQFTGMAYGTNVNGEFMKVAINSKSKKYIRTDVFSKIFKGTITWFFHLVSDMAGSHNTAGLGGGTGIPGPILSLAKELSALPLFKQINVNGNSLSVFISKIYNGTLFAEHDEKGRIIKETVFKFDLRSELAFFKELEKQAIPVVANDCIVRFFYFIRHLAAEIKLNNIRSISDLNRIEMSKVMPVNNPTISRMLTISSLVFSTVDMATACYTEKYWVSINYVGVVRLSIAIGTDISWVLKARNVKAIKQMYEDIKHYSYRFEDERLYERTNEGLGLSKLELNLDQAEILYNLEYLITLNDINTTKHIGKESKVKILKEEWLNEWKHYITDAFSEFMKDKNAILHWYSKQELLQVIGNNNPQNQWFKLVLLEAVLFKPYFPMKLEEKKKRKIPSKKYNTLQSGASRFQIKNCIQFLETLFQNCPYYEKGFAQELKKSYDKIYYELSVRENERITNYSFTIASALLGTVIPLLIAPTSALIMLLNPGLALMAIDALTVVNALGKDNAKSQSAKLIVSIKKIFTDASDFQFTTKIYHEYVASIQKLESAVSELRSKESNMNEKEKNQLKAELKQAEDIISIMKRSMEKMKEIFPSLKDGYYIKTKID